jgi:hypothetical protein
MTVFGLYGAGRTLPHYWPPGPIWCDGNRKSRSFPAKLLGDEIVSLRRGPVSRRGSAGALRPYSQLRPAAQRVPEKPMDTPANLNSIHGSEQRGSRCLSVPPLPVSDCVPADAIGITRVENACSPSMPARGPRTLTPAKALDRPFYANFRPQAQRLSQSSSHQHCPIPPACPHEGGHLATGSELPFRLVSHPPTRNNPHLATPSDLIPCSSIGRASGC